MCALLGMGPRTVDPRLLDPRLLEEGRIGVVEVWSGIAIVEYEGRRSEVCPWTEGESLVAVLAASLDYS